MVNRGPGVRAAKRTQLLKSGTSNATKNIVRWTLLPPSKTRLLRNGIVWLKPKCLSGVPQHPFYVVFLGHVAGTVSSTRRVATAQARSVLARLDISLLVPDPGSLTCQQDEAGPLVGQRPSPDRRQGRQKQGRANRHGSKIRHT